MSAHTGYGFLILHALVTDIEPAIKVKEAMNEINAARRMRVAAAENAEAHKVCLLALLHKEGCPCGLTYFLSDAIGRHGRDRRLRRQPCGLHLSFNPRR